MTTKRKEKESNFSLLRRFARDLLLDGKLMRVKDGAEFKRKKTRREIRETATRREKIRRSIQVY